MSPSPRSVSRSRRRRRLAVPALVAVGLVAPAAAHADLYVEKHTGSDASACSAASPCKTIGKAMGLAGSGDTIHIGPGNYTEAVVAGKRIHLVGAGGGSIGMSSPWTHTIISAPAGKQALRLEQGGSVRDLKAVGGDGGSSFGRAGLVLYSPDGTRSYTVERVVAVGGSGTGAGTGLYTDADDYANLTVDVSRTQIGQKESAATTLPAMYAESTLTASLANVTIDPNVTGLDLAPGSNVTATALNINDTKARTGVSVHGGHLTLHRSRIVTGENGLLLRGSQYTPPTQAWVNDSVIGAVRTTAIAADVDAVRMTSVTSYSGLATAAHLVARGSTFVVGGPDVDAALHLKALGASSVQADLGNTVLRSTDTEGSAGDSEIVVEPGTGTETVIASHSAWSTVENLGNGVIPAAGSGTNVAGDPGFVSEAGGTWTLSAASPLVDAGDPAGSPSLLDIVGAARLADGNGDGVAVQDIGAYERHPA